MTGGAPCATEVPPRRVQYVRGTPGTPHLLLRQAFIFLPGKQICVGLGTASLKPPGTPRLRGPRCPRQKGPCRGCLCCSLLPAALGTSLTPRPGGDGDHAPGCGLGACPGNRGLNQPGDEAAWLGLPREGKGQNAGVSSPWATGPPTQRGEDKRPGPALAFGLSPALRLATTTDRLSGVQREEEAK